MKLTGMMALLVLVALASLGAGGGSAEKKSENEANPAALRRIAVVKPEGKTVSIAPFRDGSFILACAGDNMYRRYDGSSGKMTGEFTAEPKPEPGYTASPHDNRTMAVTPDEKHLLIADYRSHSVSIVALAEKRTLATIACDGSPYAFRSVTDAKAWVLTDQGAVSVDIAKRRIGEKTEAEDIVASPDGSKTYRLEAPPERGQNPRLAMVSENGKAERVDLGPVSRYDGGALGVSPDGKRVYVLLAGYRLMAFDGSSGRPLDAVALPAAPILACMSVSPDGAMLALWAPMKGSVSTHPSPNPGYDVQRFIQVSGQVTILETGQLRPIPIEGGAIDGPKCVAFGPDSKQVFIADQFQGALVLGR